MRTQVANEPYNKSGSYLFQKSGVFYFVRRVPRDLEGHHSTNRISFSLRTRSAAAAAARARDLAARLDRQWNDMRFRGDDRLARYRKTVSQSSGTLQQQIAGRGVGGF